MNHDDSTSATVPGPLLADAGSLPPTLDIVTAARWLGIGRTTAYRLAEHDEFPVPVLRIGRCYRVPTAPLIALLGIRPEPVRKPTWPDDRCAALGPCGHGPNAAVKNLDAGG